MAVRLVRIGYWQDERDPGWPDPSRYIDPGWDASERESVAGHLRRGFVARAYLGRSRCRICAAEVGSLELSDGTFIWPEGLVHYVEEHQVRLPARFTEHVNRSAECLEQAEVDDRWWRETGGAS
jgi:hypothetical protein